MENASSVGFALVVWIITGVITAIGALCYAELGVTIPKSGGDYSYVKDIFGGLAGWVRCTWCSQGFQSPWTLVQRIKPAKQLKTGFTEVQAIVTYQKSHRLNDTFTSFPFSLFFFQRLSNYVCLQNYLSNTLRDVDIHSRMVYSYFLWAVKKNEEILQHFK